jgi:hypothetical protein
MPPEIATLNEVARLTAIIVALLIAAATAAAVVGLWKAPEQVAQITLALIQSGSVIRMAVALVIVAAIIGLRVLDKVTADSAITALSGIAGYVLGGVQVPRRRSQKTEPPQSN